MPLGALLEVAAEAWPDRVLVGSRESGKTASAILEESRAAAAYLHASGAKTVAFLDVNGPAFVVALWAAAIAGLPICPLSYRMSQEMLVPLLQSLDEPLVIGSTMYRPLIAGAGVRFQKTDDFLAAAAAETTRISKQIDDEAPAVLLFTSGTTAAPKAVVLSHANLVSYVLETVEFGAAAADDSMLACMPPYHVAGVNGVLTNVFAGRRLVHLPNFSPEAWLATVKREGITHTMLVPTMLVRIVDALGDATADVPSLRHLAYGGSQMPRVVLEKALAAFPNVDFVNAYGLTETSSTIAVFTPEDHRIAFQADEERLRERLDSVGRVLPGVEAQIRGGMGIPVPTGESGELWLRGRQISGTYVGAGSVLDSQGWFPTRDRARFDADGYLYLEGRADDTIIRGGENISPAEIEEVLVRHPDVADAAVTGVPDEEWGERIVAAVVLQPRARAGAGDLVGYVQAHLRASRTPDEVVVVPGLPYTPTGKLVRRDLAALLPPPAYPDDEQQLSESGEQS